MAEIHHRYGGQRQGGISTPPGSSVVVIFTGEAGKQHGYADFWDDNNVFHYYGEGQRGDMTMTKGNRAILRHSQDAKRLLLFQSMGKGRPYRFLGEFRCIDYYERANVPDTEGYARTALVFRLVPIDETLAVGSRIADTPAAYALRDTTVSITIEARRTQSLFRRRLITIEKACRLTGVADLRFLRASHIKPWSKCAVGEERVDGANGLLLTPTADLLFDRGWITFDENGLLVKSADLPGDVVGKCGLDLRPKRDCGTFTKTQDIYLGFHRDQVFDKAFRSQRDPEGELREGVGPSSA